MAKKISELPADVALAETDTAPFVSGGVTVKASVKTIRDAVGAQPPFPTIWAHRGASYQAPENSLSAWDVASAAGFGLEGDWRLTSDGALVAMHDATVDRTTTSSGNVSAFTLAQMQAMDNGSKWSPLFSTERVPSFEQFLQRYPRTWLLPEVSDVTLATALRMARQIQTYGAEGRTILQMFEGAPFATLGAVKLAVPGIQVIALTATGGSAPNLAAAVSAGIDWLGVDINSAFVNAAWVDSVHAVGIKVAFYTIDDYASMTLANSYGFDALFSGRPFAMRRLAKMAPAPPNETWVGQNRAMWGDDWFLSNMTAFNAPGCRPNNGNCGTDLTTLTNGGAVLFGRPLPAAATTYQIKTTVTLGALNGDATRWAAVQIALQQDSLVSTFSPCNGSGYHCLIRQNGTIEIAKFDNGVASTTLATTPGAALVVGTPVPITIDVTPTQITITRNDTGASATAATSTYRGGIMGLIWSNLAARFGPIRGA